MMRVYENVIQIVLHQTTNVYVGERLKKKGVV